MEYRPPLRGSGPGLGWGCYKQATPTGVSDGNVLKAISNSNVLAIATAKPQSAGADWREWAAYVSRAVGQQAGGVKPDFMMPVSREHLRFEDATNTCSAASRRNCSAITTGPGQSEPHTPGLTGSFSDKVEEQSAWGEKRCPRAESTSRPAVLRASCASQ